MLYHLLYPFHTQLSVLNVTRYITFRTAAATLSALAISLALGPWLIRKLREFQIGQVIRAEGPQSHRPKAGTPTMGGLLILTAALVPTLLWADLTNVFVWIAKRRHRSDCRRSCSSAGRTLPPPSGAWHRPTRRSALPRLLTFRRSRYRLPAATRARPWSIG